VNQDLYVVGVSMSNHDRSACLLRSGRVVAAIAEERLDRRKRSEGFYGAHNRGTVLPPLAAIHQVLRKEGIAPQDVDLWVCGRSIRLCRDTLLQYLPVPAERIFEPPLPGHHLAHAYSAYGTAPFGDTAVLVVDEQGHHLGDGRFEKAAWYTGSSGPLTLLRRFEGGPDDLSIGMLYNAFAAFTGLNEAGQPAAGKLMGLAPLGTPRPEWPELVALDADTGDTRISLAGLDDFFTLAGLPVRPEMAAFRARQLDDLLAKYEAVWWSSELGADLARKAQDELERALLHVARGLRQQVATSSLGRV
jgi:carbamoyltransferase